MGYSGASTQLNNADHKMFQPGRSSSVTKRLTKSFAVATSYSLHFLFFYVLCSKDSSTLTPGISAIYDFTLSRTTQHAQHTHACAHLTTFTHARTHTHACTHPSTHRVMHVHSSLHTHTCMHTDILKHYYT